MKHLKNIRRLSLLAQKQGISMQRKFMLYMLSMAGGILAFLVLVFSLLGLFSGQSQKIHESLELQLQNATLQISQHRQALEAQCIQMSGEITRELQIQLSENGLSAADLNDNPEQLLALQEKLVQHVYTTLRLSECSGAFVVLNATTNTCSDRAEHSAAGVYLRYANLNAKESTGQDVVYFRGIPEIARSSGLELHNRWNLEFDTELLPGYESLLHKNVDRLADSYFWTDCFPLSDTWEKVSLLYVPILENDGGVCGICGVELSALYSYLSYPAIHSPYGPMITVLAPAAEGQIQIGQGLTGGLDGTFLGETNVLGVKTGKYFNRYTGESESYLGLESQIAVRGENGNGLTAAVLIPEGNVQDYHRTERLRWIGGSFAVLVGMFLMSRWLSGRCVTPIVNTLQTIQTEGNLADCETGISELDGLMAFMNSKKQQKIPVGALPPDIEELFQTFAERARTLSAAERGILRYYVEGYEISQVPELAFVSIHTVKKHNSNIYQKLGIASRDELMLYIELFRRCDRLREITEPAE